MRATTIRDLASDMVDEMGLEHSLAAVEWAIGAHRDLFGRYADITAEQRDLLERAVWADLTGGAAWPWPAEGE